MIVSCIECDWKGKYNDYKSHYKIHEKIICVHCKITFSNDEQLKKHLDSKNGNCELQPMQCLYSNIGCDNEKQYNRKTLMDHSNKNVQNHLEMVYNDFEPRIRKIENIVQSSEIYSSVAASSAPTLESSVDTEESEKSFSSLVSNQKNKGKSQRETSDSSNKKAKSSDNEEVIAKLAANEYKLDSIGEGLNTYTQKTEKLSKELEEVKTNERKLKEEIDNLQRSLTFAQATIISLEERLLSQEKASYNGTLVWKITNVRDKIQEAKSGRQASIYSSPFYTHQNGFKMCGRIYLNGDGMGRNTHVSLFFVIMRGEYDALLRWPFRQKVTFILLDQSTNENKENVIDAFRPDPNSNSFKKPTSDMNIASGIPLFCPLAKLNSNEHEYIKDDSMFIKIIIDSRDLIDI